MLLSLKNKRDLIHTLLSVRPQKGKRVAIMAGHFMLMYDHMQDELVPMIWQDAVNHHVIAHSKTMAGDFPLRTFKCGVELVKSFAKINIEAKIVLLVNDHKFRSESFQPFNQECVSNRTEELRRKFYYHNSFPNSFRERFFKNDLKPASSILMNNDIHRPASSLLPKECWYYSEQALRGRFKHTTRKTMKQDDHFRIIRLGKGMDEIFYREDEYSKEVCLTEEGACGCCGEIIQFFLEIAEKGFQEIIFFTPDECTIPVEAAAEVTQYFIEKHTRMSVRIFIVSGMGGMGEVKPPDIIKLSDYVTFPKG